MATYSENSTISIKRVAAPPETLAANEYAQISYVGSAGSKVPVMNVTFGPGEGVPASFTHGTDTYTFNSGVVFYNTP